MQYKTEFKKKKKREQNTQQNNAHNPTFKKRIEIGFPKYKIFGPCENSSSEKQLKLIAFFCNFYEQNKTGSHTPST